jgi:hypothetical protein
MASRKKLRTVAIGVAVLLGFIGGYEGMHLLGGWLSQRLRPAVTEEAFLQALDRMPMYQALKRADPEAYSRLGSEVAKRVAGGAPTRDIEAYTEAYTASFRRGNVEAALAAPPDALAALMRTLSDIVDYLHARDEGLCAEYTLEAVASQRIRALVRSEPAFLALIQSSATAVFDTIAEGRKHQGVYEPLAEADIQLAIQALQARGWSDQMRADLADPDRLRTLPAALVCRMHREWLAVLASLPDPHRTRWYREVLGHLLRA